MQTKIEPKEVFECLGFEKIDIEYAFGTKLCYKAPGGEYCRLDHFWGTYVVEYAENEEEARLNVFEDGDRFDDDLPKDELIAALQQSIRDELNLK